MENHLKLLRIDSEVDDHFNPPHKLEEVLPSKFMSLWDQFMCQNIVMSQSSTKHGSEYPKGNPVNMVLPMKAFGMSHARNAQCSFATGCCASNHHQKLTKKSVIGKATIAIALHTMSIKLRKPVSW